jgi:hypothetical protein
MRRRDVLAALSATALAGCGGTDGDGTVGSATTAARTEYPFYRQVRAEAVDPGGLPDVGLEPSLRAVDRRIDADSTATVELHLANTTDEDVRLGYERCPPADVHVGQLGGEEGDILHLFRADEWDGDRTRAAADICWRPQLYDVETGDPCRVVPLTVPAGETLVRAYEVWDAFSTEPCLLPGPYVFTETFVPGGAGGEMTTSSDGGGDSTTTADGGTGATTTPDGGAGAATTSAITGTGAATTTAEDDSPPTTTASGDEPVRWSFQVGVYEAGAASPTSAPSPDE